MSFRRIVMALGTSGSVTTIATAVDLARALEAELLGLFVESDELLDLAALPFAGEIGYPSPIRRTLDVDAVESGLRAQAQRIRQDLAARLAGLPIKWTFEVARGRIAALVSAATTAQDLVVVAVPNVISGKVGARALAARAFRDVSVPVLLVGESARRSATIVVVPPPHAAPPEIAGAIAALAPHSGRAVLFVVVDPEPARQESWQREMEALLASHGVASRYRRVARADRSAIERMLAAEKPQLVVAVARAHAAHEALLDTLPWPLLVLPGHAPDGPYRTR